MDYLIAQQALYIVFAALLGLALGWWLGRSSSGKEVGRAVNGWQERLASSENEHEEASQEVQRLAGQVSALNIEMEESRDKAVTLAAQLADSQRQLAGEREETGDLRSQTEERDSRNAELTSEISRWRLEVETLQQELLAAQEDLRRAEDDLEQERDRGSEQEAATARYERRIAALETAISTRRSEEDGLRVRIGELRGQYAELDEEATRLRQVKLEFQEWMRDAAQREEEVGHAHRQLAAVGNEREVLATEVASLEGDLDQARREASSLRSELDQKSLAVDSLQRELDDERIRSQAHDATVAASRGDRQELTEELARAGERIRELEADEALASRLAAEIEGLHAELTASMERERDLRHRAEAAEAAHAEAAKDMETLLSAPLVDVDRLATSRAGATDDDSGDTFAATRDSGPELLAAPRGAADDLKRIRGIGPVLERLLNRLGVYHFRQIANWTPAEISWVASHVNTFPDRVERDGWTIQAAELQRDQDGEEE